MHNAISWRDLNRQSKSQYSASAFFNGIIAAFVFFTLFITLAQLT
ncbi:hypothetical protein ACFL1U_01220 [Patescibacteria group bacterium]